MNTPTAEVYPDHIPSESTFTAAAPRRRRREAFAPPEAWMALLARIEARTGVQANVVGLFTAAAYHWTAQEIDAAEQLLDAYCTLAEHDPAGLDVELHQWARLRRQDVREGRWWHARRRGLMTALRKRRDAEHAALRYARAMRGEGVAA